MMKNIYILTEFISWLEDHNYSNNTIQIYERYLIRYNQFLLDTYGITINDPEEFVIYMIDDYIQILQVIYSPKTVNLIINSIRSYMKYCDRMDYCQYDYRRIITIKEDDKEAVFVNKEDYETITARISFNERDRATRLRNIIICRCLFEWWFRVSELIDIKMSDFQVSGKHIYVQIIWKGRILRTVAINPKTYEQIKEYVQLRKSNNDYVFISHANNSYWKPISRNWVSDMVKKYRNLCGINKKITPHSFRHGGATEGISRGMNLPAAQKVLGHKHITTTQIYVHIVDKYKFQQQELMFD